MMNNDYMNQSSQNVDSPEIYAARLSLIGSTLSTLGDGLQTITAGIALQELKNQSSAQNSSNESDHTNQIEIMQKQIERLAQKIERLERRRV